jgi:hypothetical protein
MTAERLESLRASFNRRLRAEGKADRTLVLYGQSINYFSEFLAQAGLRADLDNLTRDNVLIWLVSLRTRKLTDGTIRTRWRGIRRFVGWLVTEGIIDHSSSADTSVRKILSASWRGNRGCSARETSPIAPDPSRRPIVYPAKTSPVATGIRVSITRVLCLLSFMCLQQLEIDGNHINNLITISV